MQDEQQFPPGVKPVAEWTKPMPQVRVIPWGWIMIGVFVLIDAIVFWRLSAWTMQAWEAADSTNPAYFNALEGDAVNPLQPFARTITMVGVCLAILATQTVLLWIYAARR